MIGLNQETYTVSILITTMIIDDDDVSFAVLFLRNHLNNVA